MMAARIVTRDTYDIEAKTIKNVFNTAAFAELNRNKVDCIDYVIVYKDTSPRFGVVFGRTGNEWRCPFSAPFGYIEPLKKEQTVANYEECLVEIEALARSSNIKRINITFPPAFYDVDVINTWQAILLNKGWSKHFVDIDFSLKINSLLEDYEKKIQYNARRNLRIAMDSMLSIIECRSSEEKSEAYNIIRINRQSKGYRLSMSEPDVMNTINVVPARMFIVKNGTNSLASALVYDVTDDKALIVYWGDIPGCQDKKVINFLAYELLKIYESRSFSYIDIGPSTEQGIANYGLCNFKDSIGCTRTAKFWLYKDL